MSFAPGWIGTNHHMENEQLPEFDLSKDSNKEGVSEELKQLIADNYPEYPLGKAGESTTFEPVNVTFILEDHKNSDE